MIKLDLSLVVAAICAVLASPAAALAELGIIVNDEEVGLVCQPLSECEGGGCDGDASCESLRSDGAVMRCNPTDGQLAKEVICCAGEGCCATTSGCTLISDTADCLTVSGLTSSTEVESEAVLCAPGILDGCSETTVRRSVSALEACFTQADGTPTRFFGRGDCDGDSVTNHIDSCLCGCPDLGGDEVCTGVDIDPATGCPLEVVDAGMTRRDAGTVTDAGMSTDDAGAGEQDAGEPGEDAGSGGFDAANPDGTGDAGFAGDGGCECRTSAGDGAPAAPLAGAVLVLAALGLRRRR